MYLHLGQDTVIRSREVIGIFDLESTTVSGRTRLFLRKNEQGGRVISVSYELPKSFVLCSDQNDRKGKNARLYLSQLAPATLYRRFRLAEKDPGAAMR